MKSPNKNNNLFTPLFVFISLLSISLLSACGGGGGDDPVVKAVVDVNPIGFYQGTASVNETGALADTLTVTDLQAIVDVDTFVVMSVSNHLMYKGTISDTTITGNAFSATVRIYKDGVYQRDTTMKGTVTEASKILVTLTGAGDYATGSVDLDYDPSNSQFPLVYANGDGWLNDPFTVGIVFSSDNNFDMYMSSPPVLNSCDAVSVITSNVNSEQPGRIRSFSATLQACSNNTDNGKVVDGYFVNYTLNSANDRILFVIYNNDEEHLGILALSVT
ncbi:MAG: hypothetical protein OEY89_06755 [Gammaproteobacteria bacterium]|nr:hypothetical protein [Gammaproteobacteria bacterium]